MDRQHRRTFIKSGLAAAGWLAAETACPELAAAADLRPNPALGGGGGFRLGTVTYNLGKDWDLATLIKNCETTGFEAVELRTTHKHGVEPAIGPDPRRDVKKRFADARVRLLSLGTVCEYHAPDATIVRKNVEETKQFVKLAQDIGALGVKVRPNGIPKNVPEEKTLEQIGRALRECGQAAQEHGVEIWLEVHGRDSSVPRRVRRMMEVADHHHVGVCWNSNAEDVEKDSVQKTFDLLRPWLRNVHINELWKPDYPWRELFGLLKKSGYNRYTLAEVPETSDPIRLMRYYRGLWLELCR